MYDVTDVVSYISLSEGQNNLESNLKDATGKFGVDIDLKLFPTRLGRLRWQGKKGKDKREA